MSSPNPDHAKTPWQQFRSAPMVVQATLWVVAAVIVLAVIVSIASGGKKTRIATSNQIAPPASATATSTTTVSTTTVPSTSTTAAPTTTTTVPPTTATPTTTVAPPISAPPTTTTVARATPAATASLCGAPSNPYGYNFCKRGTFITQPAQDTCSYFSCIQNFWNGKGYMVECQDTMYSMSGGRSGACSYHSGETQPVYSGP